MPSNIQKLPIRNPNGSIDLIEIASIFCLNQAQDNNLVSSLIDVPGYKELYREAIDSFWPVKACG